ncbi:TonB-dependent receptor [Chitinophagaceae bacterium LB-8]|uniref:TonB-dependent receptor n=1 Tax=Paraflavisolibacter caeni TaxID=2982496 RepID=A0A9X3BK47_9BACT|nr:TonB-dependent receptor [Paraflavisolibacter caeni]MCU7552173.1 TonB-dependent receptor [Paraflavisolibacter caeni]
MRRFLVLIVIAFFSLNSFSQMQGRNGQQLNGRFYGRVVDASNKGVDAASVILLQVRMDSATQQRKETTIGGMLTKPNGEFSIENVPARGRYLLRITGIGFKPHEQPVAFERPSQSTGGQNNMMAALDKDLGNIKLQVDDKLLNNVTVTSSKPQLQLGIDRKIFNVEQNLVSAGGSAIDVMRNVPSVSVDIDGNISVRNSAPQIFVDGRPTTMTLEQIPADAIESVEIITNPSAKFDASGGTAGILNIILKKNKRVGYSGNVRASADSRGRIGGGGNVNLRQGKFNTFLSANIFPRKSKSTGTTDRTEFFKNDITQNDSIVHSIQNDRSLNKGVFGFGRAGFDYFINNRNTLTVSGTYSGGKMRPNTNSGISFSHEYDNWDSLSNNDRTSNSNNEFKNWGGQISFKHNFPKSGHEWTADATYNQGENNNENLIKTDYYRTGDKIFDRTYQQQQIGNGINENLVLQSDYVNPLNENSKFEAGVRASIRSVSSTNNFYSISEEGIKLPITRQSIAYESNDNVYAGYINYASRIKNFGYQLGLRAENSEYNGDITDKGQSFKIKYDISLFPSVFLSQKVTDNDELQFNYSRRINRPNFWQLIPFTDYADSLNISRGNPNLKPEFTNSFELSYSKSFKNRDNFIASLYFKNTNDLITRYISQEYDTVINRKVIVSSYVNANSSYVTGLELTSRNKITKWWELTSNVNFYTSKIDLKDVADPDQFLSYFIKLNNNLKLPKNFSIQISGDYDSKRLTGGSGGGGGGGRGGGGGFGGGGFGGGGSTAQGYIRPQFDVDAAIRYDFLKDRAASISLSMNDVFRTRKFDSHTQSLSFTQDVFRRRDPQILRLNFNWRFGKFDANLFKRKNNREEGGDQGSEGMNF